MGGPLPCNGSEPASDAHTGRSLGCTAAPISEPSREEGGVDGRVRRRRLGSVITSGRTTPNSSSCAALFVAPTPASLFFVCRLGRRSARCVHLPRTGKKRVEMPTRSLPLPKTAAVRDLYSRSVGVRTRLESVDKTMYASMQPSGCSGSRRVEKRCSHTHM